LDIKEKGVKTMIISLLFIISLAMGSMAIEIIKEKKRKQRLVKF